MYKSETSEKMKDLNLFIILGLSSLLTAIGGPINSDPAPGRSPGPPLNNHNEVFSVDEGKIFNNIDADSNKNVNQNTPLTSSSSTSIQSSPSSMIFSSILAATSAAALSSRKGFADINSDGNKNLSSGASASIMSSTSSSKNWNSKQSSEECLDNFFNGYDKVVQKKTSDVDMIHLDVVHDVFIMENGLMPYFVYLGESLLYDIMFYYYVFSFSYICYVHFQSIIMLKVILDQSIKFFLYFRFKEDTILCRVIYFEIFS